MIHVDCQQLSKQYGEQVVLDRLDWTLEAGQSWALVGPSGAGKTTFLRIVAGLERGDSGEISFLDGNQQRVRQPRVGMVFQHLGLWPHLTASQHVACVLKHASPAERMRIAADRLAEVCLPAACHDKRPEQLSGGEAQRLAIARALAVDPRILLLDEPLAQVDTMLRAELLALLRELITKRGMTSIYVTHSWGEASRVADQVAVLLGGRMIQAGDFSEVYRHPATATVARLTGPVVEIPRRFANAGRIGLTERAATINMQSDPWVIRPQQLEVTASDGENRWEVIQCRPFGFGWEVIFANGDDRLCTPTCQELGVGAVVGLHVRHLSE